MDLKEYVEVYGNYNFTEKNMNDIDFCILSLLSYLKFDGIVGKLPEKHKNISLLAISKKENIKHLFKNDVFGKSNEALFYLLVESNRFKNIEVNYYANIVDEYMETQFSAITCFIGSYLIIVYRGTDEHMVGWREDFHIAFSKPTIGHLLSAMYLEQVLKQEVGNVIVCGHSKGGNLAMYASARIELVMQNRITKIYLYDSPGLRRELLDTDYYIEAQKKVRKIVPQSTVVGMFLQNQEPYIIIKSSAIGVFQHNPFTWEIKDENKFLEVKAIGKRRNYLNTIFNKWILAVKEEELAIFIEVLFEILEGVSLVSFIELLENKKKHLPEIGKAYGKIDKYKRNIIYRIWKQYVIIFIGAMLMKKKKEENIEIENIKVENTKVENIKVE
ncbi:MAG: Mbeg1-like protein, partial [Eubacteriales bacterium]